jgi:putative membrane protein
MTLEIFLRYVHFLCIFAIVGSLVSEHTMLRKSMTRREIGRLATIDAVYGIAAMILVVAGLTLWLGSIGKPAVFYTKNWIFHTKLTVFILIGLSSIVPTIFFTKNRKGNPDEIVTVPGRVYMMLRLELLLLAIMPLLAGLMAHGVGFFGH